MRHIHPILACCAFVLVSVAPARAQDNIGGLDNRIKEGISYHVYAKPGEVTMQVQVLGDVGSSGIYELGTGMDLGQLLALIGGAPLPVKTRTVRRKVTIRLLRDTGTGMRTPVYEVPVQQFLQETTYPTLEDGDVLIVEVVEKERIGWSSALRLVSAAGTIVLLIDRLTRR